MSRLQSSVSTHKPWPHGQVGQPVSQPVSQSSKGKQTKKECRRAGKGMEAKRLKQSNAAVCCQGKTCGPWTADSEFHIIVISAARKPQTAAPRDTLTHFSLGELTGLSIPLLTTCLVGYVVVLVNNQWSAHLVSTEFRNISSNLPCRVRTEQVL